MEAEGKEKWIEVAVDVIKRTIVILSGDNRMAYMDKEYEYIDNSQKKMPLFLVKDIEERFTMILPGYEKTFIQRLSQREGVKILGFEEARVRLEERKEISEEKTERLDEISVVDLSVQM
jgi:hypothetical protein